MKIVALIQARTTSSRLPGKVLLEVATQPLIFFMIERMRRSKLVDEVVLLTSDDHSDDQLAEEAMSRGVEVIRGPLKDVLGRFHMGALITGADVVVRLTGDCPLIDPKIVDLVLTEHLSVDADYTSNVDPATFADGMDVECFTADLLNTAHHTAVSPEHREHVTIWMRENAPDIRRHNVRSVVDGASLRLTVDYADDLAVVKEIVAALGPTCSYFEILQLFQYRPELLSANVHTRNEALISRSDQINDIT